MPETSSAFHSRLSFCLYVLYMIASTFISVKAAFRYRNLRQGFPLKFHQTGLFSFEYPQLFIQYFFTSFIKRKYWKLLTNQLWQEQKDGWNRENHDLHTTPDIEKQ